MSAITKGKDIDYDYIDSIHCLGLIAMAIANAEWKTPHQSSVSRENNLLRSLIATLYRGETM